ncbi:MAG: transcription repressor NadR [Oscillospiraceae bacterium]|nr:transcription repressor NadR [Oscillospiraceae bacterium]
MKGAERRGRILEIIKNSDGPVTGGSLAKETDVSRQVIVQDISRLKAEGHDIIATSRGYIINRPAKAERVFKLVHSDDEIRDELELIVSMGGMVKNVFVWHKIYGKLTADINIATYGDIDEYIDNFRMGRSSPLKNVTSEYHYHTVTAPDSETLDRICEALDKRNFLVHNE